ncbi:MAG: hypothetical protein ACRCZS_12630 [Chroococcidiopsis sp.]
MQYGTIEIQGSWMSFGGKRFWIGVGVPTNPSKGDRWDEYDALGNLLERWVYTGVFWRSVSVEKMSVESTTNVLNTTNNTRLFPVYTNYNIYLANVVISGLFSLAPAVATQNWRLGISYTTTPNVLTNITNIDTGTVFSGVAANNRVRAIVPIQLMLDTAATQPKEILLAESRTAGTLTKILSYTLQYYKARP